MPKLKFPRGHPIGSHTGLGKTKIPTIYDTNIGQNVNNSTSEHESTPQRSTEQPPQVTPQSEPRQNTNSEIRARSHDATFTINGTSLTNGNFSTVTPKKNHLEQAAMANNYYNPKSNHQQVERKESFERENSPELFGYYGDSYKSHSISAPTPSYTPSTPLTDFLSESQSQSESQIESSRSEKSSTASVTINGGTINTFNHASAAASIINGAKNNTNRSSTTSINGTSHLKRPAAAILATPKNNSTLDNFCITASCFPPFLISSFAHIYLKVYEQRSQHTISLIFY